MNALSFFLTTVPVLLLLGIGMQLWFSAGLFVVASSMFLAIGALGSSYLSVELGYSLPMAIAGALLLAAILAALLVPLLFRLSGIALEL